MTNTEITNSGYATHHVENQPPLYGGFNAWKNNPLMMKICGGLNQTIVEDLNKHGAWAGQRETLELGRLANTVLPVLRTHDRFGQRIDQVEFHPAYHALMRRAVGAGLHNSIWDENPAESGFRNTARAARFYISAGVEGGHLCPITMTNASAAAIMRSPVVAKEWLPRILTRKYDSSNRPPIQKTGLTIGMGMSEKQGGSDVRANTSTARDAGEGIWQLTGHKWFLSAPMCDAFLMLAKTPGTVNQQPSCFLVPRILPGGDKNGLHLQRLKDKLGNKSNASCEVEFDGIFGQLIGEEGRGISTILEMVTLTRLDCALASAGLMFASLSEAIHHCRHRKAFGEKLIDQPLMTRVLADMALDVAAATALSMRLARAFDLASTDTQEAAYARIMTPVIKYWVCKVTPGLVYEAMECIGGNGYVEEGNLARHYRESPLNAIWEGSGNIMSLDLMRAIDKGGEILPTVLSMLERDLGEGSNKTVEVIRTAAGMASADPGSARILTEQLALTAAAAELKRLQLGELTDAFIESRLGGLWRSTYGMLDNRYDVRNILDTWYPQTH
ncbi:MAG: DNA alkylation response protein [Hyphomicrobiales bacterium]|nr:DNA alkylation response protein [Hyphomicrobiales bacterium]